MLIYFYRFKFVAKWFSRYFGAIRIEHFLVWAVDILRVALES